MSVRLVASGGLTVPADKKPGADLQVFTFAIYKGHICAAINGQPERPGAAVIELADIIAKLVDDAEARTVLASWPNPGVKK